MNSGLEFEIDDAVERQRLQWGPEHDDAHTAANWGALIVKHAYRLVTAPLLGAERTHAPDYRERLIKIAALCVSAVESFDRTEITKDIPEVPK